jgi:phenylalanyl-tRNA synthetase beta chain
MKKLREFIRSINVNISLAWLSQYVDLTHITTKELAHRLTMSGLEVSNIDDKTPALEKVIIGRLKQVLPHPNADKLQLAEVEIPGETIRVVCGAPNISVGDTVPMALEGALLPSGMKIKRTKIRGEESSGMLCSERELGISDEGGGIMHFPGDTPLGTPVAELLKVKNDTIFEIEITPNRSDCLSHMGVARHVSAVLDRPLKVPEVSLTESGPDAGAIVKVDIEARKECRRYCARVIQGVKIEPSPKWLQQMLERVDIRPLNNVVDITNYVLMEIGHPLHAFDFDQLSGPAIKVRLARKGEALTTIDGLKRGLSGNELVIADADKPVALAGVMGGQDSEVTDKTVNVLLEAAWFEPASVRRTMRETGCQSESAYRFERGVDPEAGLLLALNRAAGMITEIAGGSILKGIVDQYPQPLESPLISLRLSRAEKVLGMRLDHDHALNALSRLGFKIESGKSADSYTVRVPGFRPDVGLEEDLIEEIAEIIGYDKIIPRAPLAPMTSPKATPEREFIFACRNLAVGLGLTETLNYSFLNPRHFERLRLPGTHAWRSALALKNPLNVESSLLRTSLLPGLLNVLSYNQRRGRERIYLFETGAVYLKRGQEKLPHEPKHLGIILNGPRNPMHWQQGKKRPESDFYDLKGILEGLFSRLHLRAGAGIRFETSDIPFLHPRISFVLKTSDNQDLGWAGSLHPESLEKYKFKGAVLAAELDLEILRQSWIGQPEVKPFSRFPALVRDISLAVSEQVQAGEVMQVIHSLGNDLLTQVTPFDLYQGEGLAPGTKSLAFSLTFQDHNRTLQEEEVKKLQNEILVRLRDKFGAQQR